MCISQKYNITDFPTSQCHPGRSGGSPERLKEPDESALIPEFPEDHPVHPV
jgi:hypothetical protein